MQNNKNAWLAHFFALLGVFLHFLTKKYWFLFDLNDTCQTDILYNGIPLSNIQENDIQYNNIKHNDILQNDIQ